MLAISVMDVTLQAVLFIAALICGLVGLVDSRVNWVAIGLILAAFVLAWNALALT
jgi:hypothetical protein